MIGRILYKQGFIDKGIFGLDKKVDRLDDKFDQYILKPFTQTKSPISLTPEGLEMFNSSIIQEFVEANFEEIFLKMKKKTYGSAYHAQENLFAIVGSYKTGKDKINLENEAFEKGQHIDILMKIIAIGIRDKIFAKLGLNVEEINNKSE